MLLLENVKTVCFLTSERAGAQIFAASPESPPRERQAEKPPDLGVTREEFRAGRAALLGPRPAPAFGHWK